MYQWVITTFNNCIFDNLPLMGYLKLPRTFVFPLIVRDTEVALYMTKLLQFDWSSEV